MPENNRPPMAENDSGRLGRPKERIMLNTKPSALITEQATVGNDQSLVRIPIELRIEIVSRPDREVYGWCYLARGVASPRAVIIVLNRNCWLTERALAKADTRLTRLLVAQAFFDRARRARELAELFKTLKAELVPEKIYADSALLSIRAINHPRFAVVTKLPIYGENKPTETRFLLSTVSVLMSKGAAAASWVKLKEAKRRRETNCDTAC